MTTKQNSRLFTRPLAILEVFSSAVAATAAVRVGHAPDPRDLAVLGIRPEDFGKIGRA